MESGIRTVSTELTGTVEGEDDNMAEYDSLKSKQEKLEEQKKLKETYYRLTAPVHVTLNSYKEHERIEGYYEFKDYGNIFQCDRLLKLETI